MPPVGPMSDVDDYDSLALRLDSGNGRTAGSPCTTSSRRTGTSPSSSAGSPAILLTPGTPRDTVTTSGAVDGIAFDGHAELRDDGSA